MTDSAPRAEYTRRMHRVLAHVDRHLDAPLQLADLAAVAHFSPYHFHRLFTAWMGETLGDFLRRRRLEVAALRLLTQPRSSVLQVALQVGFGSGEAFARAFRGHFGCSATEWRRQQAAQRDALMRKMGQARRKDDQDVAGEGADDGDASPPPKESTMQVTLVQRDPVQVAYLRHVGPYGAAVHAFWQSRFFPFLQQNGLTGRPIYGISHDDPTITPPEKCRYDVAVVVDAGFVAPEGVQITTVEGGRYVVLPFLGTSDEIGPVWTALLRDWLPGSGWQLDNRPAFEYYPPDAVYEPDTGLFSCQIMIPLAPLNA